MSDHRPAHTILIVAALLMLSAAGVVGYRWMMQIPLDKVTLHGNERAESADILELAKIDTSAMLFRLDDALIADRVERHPWVEEASVLRLPTGTMRIDVEERRPVVQVLDASGRIATFLDVEGAMMPVNTDTGYEDIPVLSGLTESYHPMRTVSNGAVRELLPLLATMETDTHRLISEIAVTGSGLDIYMTPVEGRPSTRVRLGDSDFEQRLVKLSAFWEQQMGVRPDTRFELIDLRFNSQITTREFADARASAGGP